MDSESNNIAIEAEFEPKQLIAQAILQAELLDETPLRRLTRKMINMERKYLFSEQGVPQRKAKLKDFIDDARKAGEFKAIINENKA